MDKGVGGWEGAGGGGGGWEAGGRLYLPIRLFGAPRIPRTTSRRSRQAQRA